MRKITLLIGALLACISSFAQIPNGGFESWMNMGSYTMPDSWDQLNAMTDSSGTFTCMQGSPGDPGSYFIKLVTKSVSGMGVMPGIATCGTLDMSNMSNIKPLRGFPFTSRVGKLTGNWQYMASGSDQGYISVLLTKWNTAMAMRDTVAYATQNLSGMAMSWSSFSIDLKYLSASAPDSAIIVLSSSGASPAAGSYLFVDNLAFSGSPTAVNDISGLTDMIALSPNPAKNVSTLRYTSANAKSINVALLTLEGKTIWNRHFSTKAGENSFPLDISTLSAGIYMVHITDNKQSSIQRLIVQ